MVGPNSPSKTEYVEVGPAALGKTKPMIYPRLPLGATRAVNVPEPPEDQEPSRQVRRQEERRVNKVLAAMDRLEDFKTRRGDLRMRAMGRRFAKVEEANDA